MEMKKPLERYALSYNHHQTQKKEIQTIFTIAAIIAITTMVIL